jgi:DNA-binding transcriptional ArsR family regulator
LLIAGPAQAAVLSFRPPGEYEGTSDTNGASWVLLVFARNASADFNLEAPGGGTLGNDTLYHPVRIEDAYHLYRPADRWEHSETPFSSRSAVHLSFAPTQAGSLYIQADRIRLQAGASKGVIAIKPGTDDIDAFGRPDDRLYDRYRTHDPPGVAVAVTAERARSERAMPFQVSAEGQVYAEWYAAGIQCGQANPCPTGGGPSVTQLPGPPGYKVTTERHTYESLLGANTTLAGGGDLDYAVVGGAQVSFGLAGSLRLPLSTQDGSACPGCPAPHDQTLALTGNMTLEGLHPDGSGLYAEPHGDLQSARIDERSVDPRAIVGGAVVAAAAVAAGGWLLIHYLASSLFTRIRQPEALEQPRRKAIYEAVAQDPGLSMSELGRRTGISKGALLHHLNIMKDLGLIHERRFGHSIRLFIDGVPVSSQISLATLQNQTARNLCSLIAKRPGILQHQILAAFPGIPRSSVQFHLRHLVERQVIVGQRIGRTMVYSMPTRVPLAA